MTDENPTTAEWQYRMPFAKVCGIRVSAATPAGVRGEMDWIGTRDFAPSPA